MSTDDVVQAWIEQAVTQSIHHGFGDLYAPLAEGEYIHEVRVCPHYGCTWQLPMVWRNGIETTRQRGLLAADAIIQDHLETHVAENWKATP